MAWRGSGVRVPSAPLWSGDANPALNDHARWSRGRRLNPTARRPVTIRPRDEELHDGRRFELCHDKPGNSGARIGLNTSSPERHWGAHLRVSERTFMTPRLPCL